MAAEEEAGGCQHLRPAVRWPPSPRFLGGIGGGGQPEEVCTPWSVFGDTPMCPPLKRRRLKPPKLEWAGRTRSSTSKASIAPWAAWGGEESPRTATARSRGPGRRNGAERHCPKDPQLQKLRGCSFRKISFKKPPECVFFFVHKRNIFPPYNQLYIPVLLMLCHCAVAMCSI